jgi:hypothetical protein
MSDYPNKPLRTVEVEPDQFSLIKPDELVDIVELSPLTLQDRWIYYLLILSDTNMLNRLRSRTVRQNLGRRRWALTPVFLKGPSIQYCK